MYDLKFLIPLLRELKIRNCNVLADWAYDMDEIIKYISTNNANLIIYPKSNRKIKRKIDKHIHKERHLVESYFKNLNGLGGFS